MVAHEDQQQTGDQGEEWAVFYAVQAQWSALNDLQVCVKE